MVGMWRNCREGGVGGGRGQVKSEERVFMRASVRAIEFSMVSTHLRANSQMNNNSKDSLQKILIWDAT